MCALLLSTTVRALRPALALAVSGGLWSVWCLGVTAFWHSSVVPGSTTPPIESSVAPGPASAPLRLKEDEDPRLPVTLVTGFLGSGGVLLLYHRALFTHNFTHNLHKHREDHTREAHLIEHGWDEGIGHRERGRRRGHRPRPAPAVRRQGRNRPPQEWVRVLHSEKRLNTNFPQHF